MKFVALLRAINVGGKSIIKMSDLRLAFEKAGYSNIITYIQSGNVIFVSPNEDTKEITSHLESELSKTFSYTSKIVLRSENELRTILKNIPDTWKTDNDLRCYIAFVREPVSEKEVLKEIETTPGIDNVSIAKGVVYMSTKMDGLTKSKFTKFIGKKLYKEVTMRNLNTARKILDLMQ